jgi:hypothetical protein
MIEGDAVVIGSSRLEQLEQVLGSLRTDGPAETPLPTSIAVALDGVWETLQGMPYVPTLRKLHTRTPFPPSIYLI